MTTVDIDELKNSTQSVNHSFLRADQLSILQTQWLEAKRPRAFLVLARSSELLAGGAFSLPNVCDLVVASSLGRFYSITRSFRNSAFPVAKSEFIIMSWVTVLSYCAALRHRRDSSASKHLFQSLAVATLRIIRTAARETLICCDRNWRIWQILISINVPYL